MVKKKKLFDQFPPVSTAQWMEKIQSDLKGADFGKKLVWRTNEGIEVLPFYRAEDIEANRFRDILPGDFHSFAEQKRAITAGSSGRT
jgi:methylmalonyl-CoA mutase